MAELFNRLPGFQQTPAGQERTVLRLLPKALMLGTLLLCLPSLAVRLWWASAPAHEVATRITTVDIYAISVLVLHWTVVFTVGIGAVIVMVMKGPAYVADAYPMEGMNRPDVPLP
ncbi:MAG TPA: hypothetical protein PKE22_00985 [Ottowia sp.]|nr:MAG: hypothetical protein BGO36_11565 [Burkholderiales bacterium 68-10]HMT57844.1 hypothetical protein [Ottowia sp.]HMT63398.1 hypothetical protein [Ottowia sp.]HMT83422.1 hypothetical protein [Ottowia sp.]HOM20282.1 hypothetical protein [Ottowia sp.]